MKPLEPGQLQDLLKGVGWIPTDAEMAAEASAEEDQLIGCVIDEIAAIRALPSSSEDDFQAALGRTRELYDSPLGQRYGAFLAAGRAQTSG